MLLCVLVDFLLNPARTFDGRNGVPALPVWIAFQNFDRFFGSPFHADDGAANESSLEASLEIAQNLICRCLDQRNQHFFVHALAHYARVSAELCAVFGNRKSHLFFFTFD